MDETPSLRHFLGGKEDMGRMKRLSATSENSCTT